MWMTSDPFTIVTHQIARVHSGEFEARETLVLSSVAVIFAYEYPHAVVNMWWRRHTWC